MATRKSAQPSNSKAQTDRSAAKKVAARQATHAELPKRKPGRPSKADIAARESAEAERPKAKVAAERCGRLPVVDEAGRPARRKSKKEQPNRQRAPGRPRKPKYTATDPNIYPWYQGVLRQDFEGFEKGNRVYAQRENRPMFAGLAKVWRLISTVDGSHARLRVSEIQMGPNLTKLIRFERNEETNPPKVRSTRNNPDAHAKLDYTFSTLDAE